MRFEVFMEVKVKSTALCHCIGSYKVGASVFNVQISFSNMLVTICGTTHYPGADHHLIHICGGCLCRTFRINTTNTKD
jgi:hypothetical protein